jgi:Tol biopolymer transport system component
VKLIQAILCGVVLILAIVFLASCDKSEKTIRRGEQNGISDERPVVQVLEKRAITNPENGRFCYPQFSSDDSLIYMTSENFFGLWYYDLYENKIVSLNTVPGGGYKYQISLDGMKIYFRGEVKKENQRRQFNIFEQDISTGEISPLLPEAGNNISPPQLISDDILVYFSGYQLRMLRISTREEIAALESGSTFYRLDHFNIAIFQNGKEIKFPGFGDHPLLWPEWSPKKDRFLIYATGVGLYLLIPEQGISHLLGEMRAARWSPTNDLIVYMLEDGNDRGVTGSDLYIYDFQNQKSVNITNTKSVYEMYPYWSTSGDAVVYSTSDGAIEIVKLLVDATGF